MALPGKGGLVRGGMIGEGEHGKRDAEVACTAIQTPSIASMQGYV